MGVPNWQEARTGPLGVVLVRSYPRRWRRLQLVGRWLAIRLSRQQWSTPQYEHHRHIENRDDFGDHCRDYLGDHCGDYLRDHCRDNGEYDRDGPGVHRKSDW